MIAYEPANAGATCFQHQQHPACLRELFCWLTCPLICIVVVMGAVQCKVQGHALPPLPSGEPLRNPPPIATFGTPRGTNVEPMWSSCGAHAEPSLEPILEPISHITTIDVSSGMVSTVLTRSVHVAVNLRE